MMPVKTRLIMLLFPLLSGCELIYELLEIPDPRKEAAAAEAEGKAIGSACRHAGRSLEDCYLLNPSAQKAAIFAGWREMNDYMLMNELEVVPSRLPQAGEIPTWPRPLPGSNEGEIIENAPPAASGRAPAS
jgi:hypothetical protein